MTYKVGTLVEGKWGCGIVAADFTDVGHPNLRQVTFGGKERLSATVEVSDLRPLPIPFVLVLLRMDGKRKTRHSWNLDTLISLAMNDQGSWDSAWIEYTNGGYLAWEPSLGKEIVQFDEPELDGPDDPSWWKDEYGIWHQQPC